MKGRDRGCINQPRILRNDGGLDNEGDHGSDKCSDSGYCRAKNDKA